MSSGNERPGPDESLEHWHRPDRAQDAVWINGVQEATSRWGAAFVAYLLLPGVDPTAMTLEHDFIDAYAGWYPDRTALCRAQLESLGWPDQLAGFVTSLGLPPAALDFDLEQVWAHCAEVYELVERVGGIHAFFR